MKLLEENSRLSLDNLLTPENANTLSKKAALPRDFYLRPTPLVAQELLGKGIFLRQKDHVLIAEIVEVEAYLGERDAASHAFRGMTKRNWPMFETGGTCYVYFSYGMHHCMNITTREKGVGEAVLLRAVAPLFGVETMGKNRKLNLENAKNLTNGPGKLTQALGIDLAYNGLIFDRPDFKMIDLNKKIAKTEIGKTCRIGISQAKDLELRFFLKSSSWLSRRPASKGI